MHRHSAPAAVMLEEGEMMSMLPPSFTGPPPAMSTFYRREPIDTELLGTAIVSSPVDATTTTTTPPPPPPPPPPLPPPPIYSTPIFPHVSIKMSPPPLKQLREDEESAYVQMSSPPPSSIQARPLPSPPAAPTMHGVCSTFMHEQGDESPQYTNIIDNRAPKVIRVVKKAPTPSELLFNQQLEQHIQQMNKRRRCPPVENDETQCGLVPDEALEPTEDDENHVYEYVKTVL